MIRSGGQAKPISPRLAQNRPAGCISIDGQRITDAFAPVSISDRLLGNPPKAPAGIEPPLAAVRSLRTNVLSNGALAGWLVERISKLGADRENM
jgi:hypothetical protein